MKSAGNRSIFRLTVGGAAQADVADQVDELAKPLLVEAQSRELPGQHVLQRRVVALDGRHGFVDLLADSGLRGRGLEMRPARFLGHPERCSPRGTRRDPRETDAC
jgi:hypothetical protein